MQIRDEILRFLLDTSARHGDVPTSAKAKELLHGLDKEIGPMTKVSGAMPHEGFQSPLPRETGHGLGDVKPPDAPKHDEPKSATKL